MSTFEIPPPYLVFLSLLSVKGLYMARERVFMNEHVPIDRDIVIAPDILIEEPPNDLPRVMRPRALARFMSLHPHNIDQKTEVMVEHFRATTRHKIGGKAKAMAGRSSFATEQNSEIFF